MKTSRRGKNVALLGAVGQLAFAVVLLIDWTWARSAAAMACTLLLASGSLLWLMAALLLYCRQLADREQEELSELADEASASIFEGDSLAEQRLAARRLGIVERWAVPAFTLVWAGVNAIVGYVVLGAVRAAGAPDVVTSAPASLLAIVAGFGAFLFSCYAIGMARQLEWRPLRAPGSFMLVCTLMIVGVIAALIAGSQKVAAVDRVVAYIVPIVQFVLAGEMVLNFILDRYRPRVAGAEGRLSFDSRLMNLVAEPKRVGHSIAETLNYQFGFEVSHTWFYQLLQRAFVPLLIFAVVLMFAMTALVPVGQGQSAVIMRLGKICPRPVGPGLHLKWPWPIDAAEVFDLHVHTMYVGMGEHREHRGEVVRGGTFAGRDYRLWALEHGEHKETNFLVAVEPDQVTNDEAPPVDVLRLTAVLKYRIVDPVRFGYGFTNAAGMLNCLAHREMVRYCSSATLLEDLPPDQAGLRPQAIMTHGREEMAEELKCRIQRVIDDESMDLGIEIVSLNFSAIHPPPEAAEAFEEVLSTRLGQQMQRSEAEAYAARKYIAAAGDTVLAQKLALALRRQEELTELLKLQRRDDQETFVERLGQIVAGVEIDLKILVGDVSRESLFGGGGEQRVGETQEVLWALQEYRDLLAGVEQGQPVDEQWIDEAQMDARERFDAASGDASVAVAEALADRWQRELTERSRVETFPAELAAYRASPRLYKLDRYLDVWDEVLPLAAKYIVGFDPQRLEPWLNLERSHRVEQRLSFEEGGAEEP